MSLSVTRPFGPAKRLATALLLTAPFFCVGSAGAQSVLEVGGVVIADEELWAAAQEEGTVVFYTAQSGDAAREAMINGFKEDTGLDVDVVSGPAARTYERVLSEAGAGLLEADVVLMTDPVLAAGLVENNIWIPYEPVGYDQLAAEFKGANGAPYWVLYQNVAAMAYNTALVDEADLPRKWSDLLDPKWQGGKIGWTVISGGSNWARELWLRETYGLEFWEKMAAQEPVISDSNGQTLEVLSRGEVMVATNQPLNVARAASEGASVAVIFPEDGMIAYNAYIGLAATAENNAAAKVFLNWLLSPGGQEVIATQLGAYPVMKGAPAPTLGGVTLPPREEAKIVQPSEEGLIKLRDEYQEVWMRMMGITG